VIVPITTEQITPLNIDNATISAIFVPSQKEVNIKTPSAETRGILNLGLNQ